MNPIRVVSTQDLETTPEIHKVTKWPLKLSYSGVLADGIKTQPNIGITKNFLASYCEKLGKKAPGANANEVTVLELLSNVTPLEVLGATEDYTKSDAQEIGADGFKKIFTANKTWFSLSQVIRILLMCQGSKPEWNVFFSKEGSTSFILKGEKGKMGIIVAEWSGTTPTLKISGLGSGRGYNKGSRLVFPSN